MQVSIYNVYTIYYFDGIKRTTELIKYKMNDKVREANNLIQDLLAFYNDNIPNIFNIIIYKYYKHIPEFFQEL